MVQRQIQFTKDGLEKLKKELADVQAGRKQAVELLATARAMGDLSENAAYTAAKRKLGSVDAQIRRINHTLRFAVVVDREFTGKVDIGTIVTISNGSESQTYIVVGSQESDLSSGKISSVSPLGRALLGKRIGDTAHLQAPAGIISYSIENVQPL